MGVNPKIKVLGIGGSGSNTVERIVRSNIQEVELTALNTDAQALHFCKVPNKILIGANTTKGLGAGMDVSLGKLSAKESSREIAGALKGSDMVFITCGLGGGTGSGAAPVVAQMSKNLGILTVVVATTPFSFEGEQRRKIAGKAVADLKGKTDSLLVISNDNLLKAVDEKTTVSSAFEMCDEILRQVIKSITDLILVPGIINIDFASVVSFMRDSGKALFGIGKAQGQDRAVRAAKMAISSPLLDFSIKGSKGVLFNVAGDNLALNEINDVSKVITENVDPKARIISGALEDNSLKKGNIEVALIATNDTI